MIVKLVPFHVNDGGAVLSAEKISPRELTIRRSFEIRVEKCLRSFDELPDEVVEEFLPQFTQMFLGCTECLTECLSPPSIANEMCDEYCHDSFMNHDGFDEMRGTFSTCSKIDLARDRRRNQNAVKHKKGISKSTQFCSLHLDRQCFDYIRNILEAAVLRRAASNPSIRMKLAWLLNDITASTNSTQYLQERARRALCACSSIIGTTESSSTIQPTRMKKNLNSVYRGQDCNNIGDSEIGAKFGKNDGADLQYFSSEPSAFVEDLISIAYELGLVKRIYNVSRDLLIPEAKARLDWMNRRLLLRMCVSGTWTMIPGKRQYTCDARKYLPDRELAALPFTTSLLAAEDIPMLTRNENKLEASTSFATRRLNDHSVQGRRLSETHPAADNAISDSKTFTLRKYYSHLHNAIFSHLLHTVHYSESPLSCPASTCNELTNCITKKATSICHEANMNDVLHYTSTRSLLPLTLGPSTNILRILRILPNESVVLNSASRAPFTVVFEVIEETIPCVAAQDTDLLNAARHDVKSMGVKFKYCHSNYMNEESSNSCMKSIINQGMPKNHLTYMNYLERIDHIEGIRIFRGAWGELWDEKEERCRAALFSPYF